jgi:hypothetical protein
MEDAHGLGWKGATILCKLLRVTIKLGLFGGILSTSLMNGKYGSKHE